VGAVTRPQRRHTAEWEDAPSPYTARTTKVVLRRDPNEWPKRLPSAGGIALVSERVLSRAVLDRHPP
jgi:hypothetical protein